MNHLHVYNKSCVNLLSEASSNFLQNITKLALQALQNKGNYLQLAEISRTTEFSPEEIQDAFGFIIKIIQLYLTTGEKEFKQELTDVGFSVDFIDNFALRCPTELIVNVVEKIVSLKWRINVSICDSILEKKVPPSIILSVTLSNGKKFTFEMDIKMFHKLRFNVALLLRDFNNLKNSNLLK